MARLADVLRRTGPAEELSELLRELFETLCRLHGPDHPDTVEAERQLADALMNQGHTDEAERLLRDVLEISRRVLGNQHPQTAAAANSLASVLQRYSVSSLMSDDPTPVG
jgi:hypothetical protein